MATTRGPLSYASLLLKEVREIGRRILNSGPSVSVAMSQASAIAPTAQSSGSVPDLHLSVPVAATAVIVVVVDVSAAKPLVLPMMLLPVFSTVAIPVIVLVA